MIYDQLIFGFVMSRLRDIGKIALMLSFVSVVLLGCGGGGGGAAGDGNGGGNGNGMMMPSTPMPLTFPMATDGVNTFEIANDITGDAPAMFLDSVIDGMGGIDALQLNSNAVVADISFVSSATEVPTGGDVHLQNIELIRIDGGMVTGDIDAAGASAGVTVSLLSGTVGGNMLGSSGGDLFTLAVDITGGSGFTGMIDGRDGTDSVQLINGAAVASIAFSDPPQAGTGGALHLQDIETITIRGGMVNGNIVSGPDALTLNMMSGTVTGDVTGGAAADEFNLNGGTITGNVDGGAGNDSFVIGSGFTSFTGTIDGGADTDTISLAPGFVPTAANLHTEGNLQGLRLTLSGGSILAFTLTNIENVLTAFSGLTMDAPPAPTFDPADGNDNTFTIASNIVGVARTHTLSSAIDGLVGNDTLQLDAGAVVRNILYSDQNPTGGDVHVQNVHDIMINGGTVNGNIDVTNASSNLSAIDRTTLDGVTVNLISGTIGGNITGSNRIDLFVLSGDITGGSPTLRFTGVIDSLIGADNIRINARGIVANILFSSTAPEVGSGDVHVQNITIININGGMVTGNITASGDPSRLGKTFELQNGTVGGNVIGSDRTDTFSLYSTITIGGYIDGGGGTDTLGYTGATLETVFGTDFPGRGGLAADPDVGDNLGDVRNFETHSNSPGITSLSVRNIERLALSPALNLYGALSDALMQFGQQAAQGFALADLNPQTGRLTQLISKDSPFTKGRIWAHKITHSGNGKGSIGLNLTGLTARAPSDYDYQMNLTQHGFDAPIVSGQWGDFGLRAVSHTMTGTIETNIAEAQVSGYGAGLAWLWQSSSLAAHITSLAGAYEVDAHTSPSNPQAVVNEVSEGSFSAINMVISAGIADKRELTNGLVMRTTADVSWQTLSLDDFTETGAGGSAAHGIVVNFDKATRFTARIGAGLEGEHWFSDLAFVHETSSGGTLSSGLRQDYRQHDGTAFEMKFGGKIADLAPGLTIRAFAVWRQSVSGLAGEPSAQFELSYRF